MRSIIHEDAEQQVHSDENGREYVYRKDFVAGGDLKTEFSLSLVYSRHGRIYERPSLGTSPADDLRL